MNISQNNKTKGKYQKTQGFSQETQAWSKKTQGKTRKTQESANSSWDGLAKFGKKKACHISTL